MGLEKKAISDAKSGRALLRSKTKHVAPPRERCGLFTPPNTGAAGTTNAETGRIATAMDALIPSPLALDAADVAHALRLGIASNDDDFDRFLPPRLQLASGQHWTPLAVVRRVATWLDQLNVRSVCDIGSGAGKFCVAGAIASRCRFLGIERRAELIAAARNLSEVFQVADRVGFIEGTFGEQPPPSADAYYLFNPFGENLFDRNGWLDATVELSEARYRYDVAAAEYWFEAAPVGTYVVTYNGFGGTMPRSYSGVRQDRSFGCPLKAWQKTQD